MSYEQKYNKALDRARDLLSQCINDRDRLTKVYRVEDIESIFQELIESEDERIRKVLVGFFKNYKEQGTIGAETFNGIPTENILSWLEKQGEQILANSAKTCKEIPNALEEREIVHVEHGKCYYCIKDYYAGGNKRASKGDVVMALNGMSMMDLGVKANEYFIPVNNIELKPAEWSEEDALRFEEVICMIEANGRWVRSDDAVKLVLDWLKSLKKRIGG